jgi:hypothetical protein
MEVTWRAGWSCPVGRGGVGMRIEDVDEDCNILYENGIWTPCQYRPYYVFSECVIGYDPHRDCPKYDYYHKEQIAENGEANTDV